MISDIRKLAPTAAIPTGAAWPGSRLPNSRITKKASAGRDGISHANRITARSPLHQVHIVDVDGLAVAIDQDHDGQPDTDLRCGHGDHEQGKDLPRDVVELARERHQVDVDRVQHELDRHQDQARVATSQHPIDAAREEHGAEEQEQGQVDGGGADHGSASSLAPSRRAASGARRSGGGSPGVSSLRAMTMAPTRAASSSTDTTSNGRT